MAEFVVDAKEFKKAIRLILASRKDYWNQDTADLIALANTVVLRSTGTATEMDAEVVQAGHGRVSLQVLKHISKIAATFKALRLRVRIQAGRIKVERYSLSHPAIEMKVMGARIVDLPVNATAIDTLAMQKLHSAQELRESGLAARVLDAQEQASVAIDRATRALRPFGVPREAVRDLVEANIALHAKALKAVSNA